MEISASPKKLKNANREIRKTEIQKQNNRKTEKNKNRKTKIQKNGKQKKQKV